MSGAALGLDIDLDAVVDRDHLGAVGVPADELLLAFANAVALDEPDLDDARDRLGSALGDTALVEAAATVAVFSGLVRVADGTGIQLDDGIFAASADDRRRLGLDAFPGAANTGTRDVRAVAPTDIRSLFG